MYQMKPDKTVSHEQPAAKPKRRLHFGIRLKMLLGLLVVFILSLFSLKFILTQQLTQSMEDQIENDLVKLRNNTEVYVRQVMLLQNSPDFTDPVLAAETLPPLAENLYAASSYPVGIYDQNANLLYSTSPIFLFKSAFPEDAFTHASQGSASYQLSYDTKTRCDAHFIMPIQINDQIAGYVHYYIDYSDLQLESQNTLRTVMNITTFVMAIMLLFSVLLLSHFITPIHHLSAFTSRFKEKGLGTLELNNQKEDLSHSLSKRHDEIGDLSRNYSEMLETIQHQLNHIQQDRNHILQLLSSKQAFYDNVTHELKTPLTTIQGFAQLIQDSGTSDPELLQTGLDHILKESARLHTMVLQLLEMSNVKNSYELHPLDLTPLLTSVAEAMELKANRYQSHIKLTCPVHLPVYGLEDRLRQLVINLVDNAIKYGAPTEPIEITAGRRKKDEASSPAVYLCVQNSGEGMTQEQIAHIFEPFYRVDKNYSREQGSSGLGLAICQKIAQEHNAQIEVDSSPEGPTRFTVWFDTLKEDHHEPYQA